MCTTPPLIEVSKKAKIRNRYNKVPHLTQDTTREIDKNTRKHHIEVIPFPAGDHKAAMIRQESMTNYFVKRNYWCFCHGLKMCMSEDVHLTFK